MTMKAIFYILLLLSGFGLYGQSSVNHATGTMSVSIPLYTLQEGALAVPLYLNYDGSGVPVESMSGAVGQNWNLGGMPQITRAMRDKADESIIRYGSETIKGFLHEGYTYNTKYALLRDYEPDIFSLTIGGTNLRFILQKQTTNGITRIAPVFLSDITDITIETVIDTKLPQPTPCDAGTYDINVLLHNKSVDNGLSSFKVTTSDGIRYYFGVSVNERQYVLQKSALETSKYLLNETESISALASPAIWYISKIEYPKGTGTATFQSLVFSYNRRIQKLPTTITYDKSAVKIEAACAILPKISTSTEENFLYLCEPDKITSDNYEVVFNDPAIAVPTNIQTQIPDYKTGQFTDFSRKDIQPLTIQPQITVPCKIFTGDFNCSPNNPSCYTQEPTTINNPFANVQQAKVLNNIIIRDKLTSKKIGYYLHHDYFNQYSVYYENVCDANNNCNWVERRTDFKDGRLNLKGVFPLQFNTNNTTDLLPGHEFMYNGKSLPEPTSLARDHWGYPNGSQINNKTKRLYKVTSPTFTCNEPVGLDSEFSSARNGTMAYLKMPTGGVQYFDYELHNCSNYVNETGQSTTGGLRIKSINNVEPISGNETKTSYTYNIPNTTTSSGYLLICPQYIFEVGTQKYIVPSIYQMFYSRFSNTLPVSYKFVKEEVTGTKNGVQQKMGYSLYEFYTNDPSLKLSICNTIFNTITGQYELICTTTTDTEVGSLCYSQFTKANVSDLGPFASLGSMPSFEYIRTYPKSVKHYDSNNVLQSEQTYVYKVELFQTPTSIRAAMNIPPYEIISAQGGVINPMVSNVISIASTVLSYVPTAQVIAAALTVVNVFISIINLSTTAPYTENYTIQDYVIPITRVRLDKSISRSFDPSGANTQPIELTTQYFYESSTHKQLTKTQTRRSQNYDAVQLATLSEQQIKYSADYILPTTSSDPVVQGLLGLQARKMLVPIEQISKRNGKVIGGSISQFYGTSGNEGLLQSAHSLELLQPLASLTLSSVSGGVFQKDANYKQQAQITSYNTRALPTAVSKTNEGASTSITYGVNGFMPTQVSYGTNGRAFTRSTEYAVPLFGASKSTPIDNSFTTVNYDELGRIKEVKDHNGNMVKSYIYNYATTPAPNNLVSLGLYRTIGPSPLNTTIANVTDGASYSRATYMPNATSPFIIQACATDLGVDAVETVLTGPKNAADTDVVNNTLLGGCGDITGLFFVNGSYTLEAKAYKKGVLVSWKKVGFTITN
jgi:hypothetical protein